VTGYSPRFLTEVSFAIIALIVGLGVAAGVAARIASRETRLFWPNFGFLWLPQAAVLGIFLFLVPSPALFGGVASALACYFAVFATWLFSRSRPQSMAWLGCYLSLPGALIGAGAASACVSRWPSLHPVAIALLGFGLVICGIAVNQAVVCSTVMSCRGR